jgi:hypothetical protein
MVVPTYPEGGSHALCRCASTAISITAPGCASRPLSSLSGTLRRDSRNMLLARLLATADSAETFTVTQRTARSSSMLHREKVAGGVARPSVHARAR